MTNAQAISKMNELIAAEPDADRRAKLELLREYVWNPDFRAKFHDFIWQQVR